MPQSFFFARLLTFDGPTAIEVDAVVDSLVGTVSRIRVIAFRVDALAGLSKDLDLAPSTSSSTALSTLSTLTIPASGVPRTLVAIQTVMAHAANKRRVVFNGGSAAAVEHLHQLDTSSSYRPSYNALSLHTTGDPLTLTNAAAASAATDPQTTRESAIIVLEL